VGALVQFFAFSFVMKPECPKCHAQNENIKKNGFFRRKSDSKLIRRYRCKKCSKQFSNATYSPCYGQNKRRLNTTIKKLICSGVSMRRVAKLQCVSRVTVARKVKFLAGQARDKQFKWLMNQPKSFSCVQFDDLETFEHTKCKPVTVTIFIEPRKRKILGHTVAQIGAKGKLAKIALEKYGRRENDSFEKRELLFRSLSPFISKSALIQSDMNIHYIKPVAKHFPDAKHMTFKGVRGCVTGQGEMKKIKYDPLFSLNHSFAMIRDNLKRLARKSWCTTKSLEALDDQLSLYTCFHNEVLTV